MVSSQACSDAPSPGAALAAVEAALAVWRTDHPQATFAEIEEVVEVGVAQLRASLMRATVPEEEAGAEEGSARPICAACAVPLVARGRHRRQVQLWGDHTVALARRYWTCPHCGAGHFPPG